MSKRRSGRWPDLITEDDVTDIALKIMRENGVVYDGPEHEFTYFQCCGTHLWASELAWHWIKLGLLTEDAIRRHLVEQALARTV